MVSAMLSVLQTESDGGKPAEKSSGLDTSTRTLPARFAAPASLNAASETMPGVALTTSSAMAAACAKEPELAPGPACAAHSVPLGLPASREPIMTSWPTATNLSARVCPTIPVPRTAIFMRALLIIEIGRAHV